MAMSKQEQIRQREKLDYHMDKVLARAFALCKTNHKTIQLYHLKAQRIKGEPNCMVKLPCKYEGKDLVLLVGIVEPEDQQ